MDTIISADCCILAGGKSSRMGGFPKGLAKLGSTAAIDIIRQNMSCFERIFISANDTQYNNLGFEVFEDKIKDIGPISGLYTALSESSKDYVMVTCCDTPLISQNTIALLFQHPGYDAVITSDGLHEYALIGLYSCSKADILLKQIKLGNYRPFAFVNSINTKRIVLPEESLYELKGFNTQNQLIEHENFLKKSP